ncbi:MAG: gamma-glutamylcyclotransferase family protein [Candidatus Ranarchaeia archaeon]
MPWLFTYGLLTNPVHFEKIVGRWRYARQATLYEYRLVFSGQGTADIIPAAPSETVHGVAYEISRNQFRRVDNNEQVVNGAYKRAILKISLSSRTRRAYVYMKTRKEAFRRPSHRYLKKIIEGLRFHGYNDRVVSRISMSSSARDPFFVADMGQNDFKRYIKPR